MTGGGAKLSSVVEDEDKAEPACAEQGRVWVLAQHQGWGAPTSGKLQLKQEAQPHLEQVVPEPRPWRHRMRSQPWGLVHHVRLEQLST